MSTECWSSGVRPRFPQLLASLFKGSSTPYTFCGWLSATSYSMTVNTLVAFQTNSLATVRAIINSWSPCRRMYVWHDLRPTVLYRCVYKLLALNDNRTWVSVAGYCMLVRARTSWSLWEYMQINCFPPNLTAVWSLVNSRKRNWAHLGSTLESR